MSSATDEYYERLKAMTSDKELMEVANGVAEAGVPHDDVSDLYLLKVLFNKRMYHGWESVADLAAGTKRQGLYPREFGARMADRGTRRVNQRRTLPAVPDVHRPGAESTAAFRKATEVAKLHAANMSMRQYMPMIARVVHEWKSLMPNPDSKVRTDPVEFVCGALDTRIKFAGQTPYSLVPADQYLAMAAIRRPHDVCMKALRAAAAQVRANLDMPALADVEPLNMPLLPVSRDFARRFLSRAFEPYDESYFRRHRFGVWTMMNEAFVLSLYGRSGDIEARAAEYLDSVSAVLDRDLRRKFGQFASGGLSGWLRDADKDNFGYRACVFGLYKAGVAKELAVEAMPARLEAMRNHASNTEKVLQLMRRDCAVHGASTIPGDDYGGKLMMGLCFGNWKLWG